MFRRLSHLRILFLFTGIVVLLIAFISLFEVASASSTLPTTHTTFSTPTQQQDTQSSCLQAMPYAQGNPPSLNFCSPIFNGNIEGPFDSHITLIGENFPASPTMILLVPKSVVPDQQNVTSAIIQSCLSNKINDCFQVPISTDLAAKTFFIPFPWNFQVSEKLPADFFAVALLGNSPKSQYFQSPAATTFTLLTTQAPCIIVEKLLATCASAQALSLAPGSKITLQGQNWLPEKQHIQVTITCLGLTQMLPVVTSAVDSDANGNFMVSETLPQHFNGSCTIQASNQVKTVADPGSDKNTIASGALSFGNTGDNQLTLTLKLPPPGPTATPPLKPTTTPAPNPNRTPTMPFLSLSNLLALLAILPAVYALILFARSRKQPNSATGTATNRKSDANQRRSDQELLAGQATMILNKEDKPQSAYMLTAIMPDMSGRLPLPMDQAINEKKIQEAAYALSRGIPAMAVQLVERLLQSDPIKLDKLLSAITGHEIDGTSSALQDATFQAMKLMYDDRKNAHQHCGNVLINTSILQNSRQAAPDVFFGADNLFNLSYAFSSLPGISDEIDTIYLNKALDFNQQVLAIYQAKKHNPAIAATQHNLGNVYYRFSQFTDSITNLRNAIRYYEQASAYYKSADALTWAKIQTQKGNSYYELWQESKGGPDLELAIQSYKDTLAVYNPNQHAFNYAHTHYRLAKVFYEAYLGGIGNFDSLNTIDSNLKQIEPVFRRLNKRIMLANTLWRLGLVSFEFAKLQQGEKNRRRYLNQSIQYYNETLQLAQDASLRAGCYKHRGLAYELLSGNRDLEILKKAIKDYLEVLRLFDSASYKSLDDSIEMNEYIARALDNASTLSKNQRHDYLAQATQYYQTLLALYKERQPKTQQTRQRIAEIEKKIDVLTRS